MVNRASAPTANTTDFPETPKTLRGRFVNVNATPRSSIFSAFNQPWRAQGPSDYNSGGRNGFGLDDNVYQALLQNRIIFLGSEVKDENANAICAQMLLLNAEDPHKDVYLYINSPGGSVDSGMAIYDTMRWISNDVATVAIGLAASMGQFLLCAGTKGKRYALPHSRIMMHQPSGGLGGTASDIRIQAEQSLHIKATMQKLIAEHTGQTLEQIETDSDRDRWFTAEQALAYGFIDHVYAAAAQIPSPQAPNQ
jgi:ATP-dependent Clp protease protease subunit